MRHRRASIAVGFVIAMTVGLAACGNGDEEQIAELERQIDDLENRISSTTTSLVPSSTIGPSDQDEVVAFGICLDDAIESHTDQAQVEIDTLHEEIRDLAETRQAFEELGRQRISEYRILADDTRASVIQNGEDAVASLERTFASMSDDVKESFRPAHEAALESARSATRVALAQIEVQFADFESEIERLVIEQNVITRTGIDERTSKVDEIERSRDLAIDDLEIARQAATFGDIDWSTCSAS